MAQSNTGWDFLSSEGMARSYDSSTPGGGGGITALLQDPNILQGMGNAGAALSSGATVGEALNPADLIRNMQQQKATQQLLQQLLAGAGKGGTGGVGGGVVSPEKWSNPDFKLTSPTSLESNFGSGGLTSPGTKGATSRTMTENADGTFNMTTKGDLRDQPSPYGSSKPMESITSGGQNSPFWQTLLR